MFVLAGAARLWVILGDGGITGDFGYDEAVYYAAADALSHGLLPYHGHFVLVHPPLIAIVGLPFAWLGAMTTDQTGWAAENVAFALVGALDAVLVCVVARAWGLTARASAFGGAFYALWILGVAGESTLRLEPLGNLLFLVALWGLAGVGRGGSGRAAALAGVALGLLVNLKLWWAGPTLFVLAGVVVRTRRIRPIGVPLGALVVTAVLIDGPLLALTGGRMVRSIVVAQLGRSDRQTAPDGGWIHVGITDRLEILSGVSQVWGAARGRGPLTIPSLLWPALAVCALLVLTGAVALRTAVGRMFVPLALVQLAIVLAAPVFYAFYGAFLAVPIALTIAAAADAVRRVRWVTGLWPAAALVATSSVVLAGGLHLVPARPDRAQARAALERFDCIQTDRPDFLIEIDALDRGLARGCPNWIDPQGVGYRASADPRVYVDGAVPSLHYVRAMARYFRSGDAVAISPAYARKGWLRPRVLARLTTGRVLYRTSTGLVVHEVHSAGARPVRR